MSTIAFGAPVQEDVAAETPQSTTGVDAPVADLDPNDPRLTSEAIDDNAQGDAYAILPPIPDGKYRAKMKPRDMKDGQGKPIAYKAYSASWVLDKNGNPTPYFALAMDLEVLPSANNPNGKYDGYRLTDFFIKTLIEPRTGTSQASTIIRCSGDGTTQTPPRSSDKERALLLRRVQTSEAEIGIETAWEWSCEGCGKKADDAGEKRSKADDAGEKRPKAAGEKRPKALVGMHKFPNGKVAGTKDPQLQCDVCKTYSVARPRVVAYLPLADFKK